MHFSSSQQEWYGLDPMLMSIFIKMKDNQGFRFMLGFQSIGLSFSMKLNSNLYMSLANWLSIPPNR